MNRIIKIKNNYGTFDKYVLKDEYKGFGIYQEKTPNGFCVHQSWLISDNDRVELVINSFNNICKEEILDMIDNYKETSKFNVKAVEFYGSICMHPNGKFIV